MIEDLNEFIHKDKKETYEKAKTIIENLTDSKMPDNINYFLKPLFNSENAQMLDNNRSYSIILNINKFKKDEIKDKELMNIIVHEVTHTIQAERNLLNNFLFCSNLIKVNGGIIESVAYFNGMFATVCANNENNKNNNNFNIEENLTYKKNKAELIYLLLRQLSINKENFNIEIPEFVINLVNTKNFEKNDYKIENKDIAISVALFSFIREDFNIKKTVKFLLRQTNEVYDDLNKLCKSSDLEKIKNKFDNVEKIDHSIFKNKNRNLEGYDKLRNKIVKEYTKLIE